MIVLFYLLKSLVNIINEKTEMYETILKRKIQLIALENKTFIAHNEYMRMVFMKIILCGTDRTSFFLS